MKKEIQPFDTARKPQKPKWYLMPVEWIGSAFFCARGRGAKLTYHNCEGLKPPYLLLSNHASMIDFAIAAKAVFPYRSSWVISIEEFVGREWLLRSIGGIYKRKFTSDVTVVKHMLQVLKKEQRVLTMYPEARYSLAGINERISPAIGKLVKTAKCPVAVMIEKGNYLSEPQWGRVPCRHNRVEADISLVITARQAQQLSAEEIQQRIEAAFVYDDYAWQRENRVKIRCKNRAQGLHRILYQCPVCRQEFTVTSAGSELGCTGCGAHWQMDEYGVLHCTTGADTFTHVPDWYRWQRENVTREVNEGRYRFEDTVRLEHLVNAKVGFRCIGEVTLTHDDNGFTMTGTLANGEPFTFNRSVLSMESCHIEYDFNKKGVTAPGPALELATLHGTYFVFPLHAQNVLTKLHFATEALYDKHSQRGAE